jgi:hypothetical protein
MLKDFLKMTSKAGFHIRKVIQEEDESVTRIEYE